MDTTSNATREHLLAALEESDARRQLGRAERIEWLTLHEAHAPMIMGRTETLQLRREAREVFVDGHYVATLLVALSFIEHTIVEELQILGYTKSSPTFGEAITISEKNKVFPPDWLVRAKKLSLRRNSFAHLKDAEHQHALGTRIREENRHPTSILESDAKDVIDLMNSFFVATLRKIE